MATATATTATSKSQSAYYDDDDDDNNDDYVMVRHADVDDDGGGGGGDDDDDDFSFQQQWCHKYGYCGCSLFCKTPKRCLTGVAIALLYWIVLWVVATSYSPGVQRFTLTVGETWQVLPPMNLWSRKSLSIQAFPAVVAASYNNNNNKSSTESATAGLEVYEFLPVLDYRDPAPCPPLTLGDDPIASIHSPILTLHESQEMIQLGSPQHNYRQYDYEYFHLNQGSALQVHAELVAPPSQHHNDNNAGGGLGATNIYILQGYHALEEVVEHKDDANMMIQGFRGKSIEKRFLTYSGAVDLEYVVPESDYYIIVYDNAAPGRTTNLQVSVTVEMATHYLTEVSRPICSAKNTITPHGCAWIFTNDEDRQRVASTCIIVKAVSPQLDQELYDQIVNVTPPSSAGDNDGGDTSNEGNENDTSSQGSDSLLPKVDLSIAESQSVIVQVHAPLGSTRFIVLALLPIIVLLVMWFLENGQKCIQHMRRHGCAPSCRPSCPSRGRRRQQSKVRQEQMLPVVDERTPLNKSRIP